MKLSCENISLVWPGAEEAAIEDVSLAVEKGEFVGVIGPSGCGKTTLLRILSGLQNPTAGTISLDGEKQAHIAPSVGMVFQEHALFPWLKVSGNVAFGLRYKNLAKSEQKSRVEAVLERVGLSDRAASYPHQLSGGMKQRVAIARSLAQNPDFLLMDEPFAALDFQTRQMMQFFLLEIWDDFNPGIVFVTHYIDEAVILADRILLMSGNPGGIVEDLDVRLPRPRDITSMEFNEYRVRITLHLEAEVRKMFEKARNGK